jgi:hypothetical protein
MNHYKGESKYESTVQNLKIAIGMCYAIEAEDEKCWEAGEDFFRSVRERAGDALENIEKNACATDNQVAAAINWERGVSRWFDRSRASNEDPLDYFE